MTPSVDAALVGDAMDGVALPVPASLAARLAAAVGEGAAADAVAAGGGEAAGAYLDAAGALVDRLISGGAAGTRSRAAALDLLTADALVTCAFEAASDAPAALPALARAAIARLAAFPADAEHAPSEAS